MCITSAPGRINGLDTLRASAILLVLMYHTMVFVSGEPSFGVLSQIGWIGVDLFFVLSGYLIGNQIFSSLSSERKFSLPIFYARRALRTLPNFYVVLALYFLFPAELGGKAVTPLWKFLTFTQNLGLRPGSAFSHAWSLCIEEQFYLVLPLLALLIYPLRHFIKTGWIILVSLMCFAILARFWMWRHVGSDGMVYYVDIYYSTLCRFDEFLPGVALAMMQNFHPSVWQRLQKHGQASLLAGLLLVVATAVLFLNFKVDEEENFLWFTTSFGYSMLALGFALLTLSALSPNSWLYRLRIPGARSIALWSYALYLAHKPLMNVLIQPFQQFGLAHTSFLAIGLMIGISVVAAWLLFTLVETPFMQMRTRYFSGAGR